MFGSGVVVFGSAPYGVFMTSRIKFLATASRHGQDVAYSVLVDGANVGTVAKVLSCSSVPLWTAQSWAAGPAGVFSTRTAGAAAVAAAYCPEVFGADR